MKLLLGSFLLSVVFFVSDVNAISSPNKEQTYNRVNAIKSLTNGLQSDNVGLRTSSVFMLGELKANESVIDLIRILREDECEEARILAALSLYKIGDARGINAVKQRIRFDNSERVKRNCQLFYQSFIAEN
jgi:hypothetical protein